MYKMNPPTYDNTLNEHYEPGSPGNNEPSVYTVGELSAALKRLVEDKFGYIRVKGEVSGFKRATSGHLYMSLKDADSIIDIVCWRGTANSLEVFPEDGMEVIATGRISTYVARSKYQMILERLEIAGEGALLKIIEERRRRLEAQGLFDDSKKKQIPYLPETIGLISSQTGAVIRDVLHRLNDRFPRRVLLWPVTVQGPKSAEEISNAISGFNLIKESSGIKRPDLLIIARGGGSLEDLMAFNEEIVVRAAALSEIPIISAIGHETDTTLLDFAADYRAPTPTAAAELAVPVRGEILERVNENNSRLFVAINRQLEFLNQQTIGLSRGLPEPIRLLEESTQRVDDWSERIFLAMARTIDDKKSSVDVIKHQIAQPLDYVVRKTQVLRGILDRSEAIRLMKIRMLDRDQGDLKDLGARVSRGFAAQKFLITQKLINLDSLLESYSHNSVLERGFTIIRDVKGKPIPSVDKLSKGENVTITFKKEGLAEAKIISFSQDHMKKKIEEDDPESESTI